jgi:prepilin-type N-terminal cleavage/methylation domain-containing protein
VNEVRSLRKILHSLRASSGGFTLLELVVVLAIMGFLVAMIAPRLAGVVAGAQRSADDTNIARLLQATSQFQERTGRLPAEMTNIVAETGTGVFTVPVVSNENPQDGKEALSAALAGADAGVLPLHVHILSVAEAAELRRLGITEVRNFNPGTTMDELFNADAAQSVSPPLQRVRVDEGTAVLMIGAGADELNNWTPRAMGSMGMGTRIVHPSLAYRIVLGFGQDNELVTAGQLQGAAISPQGTTTDNYVFNNYLLVLPRLQSTIARGPEVDVVTATTGTGQVEEFNLLERQGTHELTVLSPEGRTFPPAQVWTVQ